MVTSDSGWAPVPDIETAADLAFTDLTEPKGLAGIDGDCFRAGQVTAIIANVPTIMAANIAAVALLTWFLQAPFEFTPVTLWGGAMIAASAAAWLIAFKFDRCGAKRRTVDIISLWAVLFGGLWALVPVVSLLGAPSFPGPLAVGLAMGVAGLGAFALSPVPAAALLFTGILATATAAAAQVLEPRSAIVVSLFAAICGVTLGAMILRAHHAALLRAADSAELERQREIIQLLLKDFEAGTSDWLWETGPDGELVYVSDRLAQLLRRDPDHLLGTKLHQAVGMSQTASGWRDLAVRMARHQPVRDLEVPVRRKGTTAWWQLNARPLHDAFGEFRGYRGVGSDVTGKRQAAAQMLRDKEQAERANAAKSRFLATMSHELRTPLNAIVGFSEIIADQREGPIGHPKYADYARSIQEGGRQLAGLISDILDISRFETGAAKLSEQEVDLVEVAEVVVKMCRGAARAKDIALVPDFAIGSMEVRGEMNRLQQIMINLVNNAVKFTPAGGTVRVTLARDQRGGVEFAVSDTGIGISRPDLKRIFEPFVQAEDGPARRFGGMGLGLAISRSLARLHDGDVVIASRRGKGTVAKLVLPPSRLAAARPRRASAA